MIRLDSERIQARRQEILVLLEDPSAIPPPQVMTKTEFVEKQSREHLLDAFRILPCYSLFIVMMVQLFQLLIAGNLKALAVIDERGAPVNRACLLGRWLVTWSLPIGVLLAAFAFEVHEKRVVPVSFLVTVSLVWLVGVMVAVVRPTRGWQDQICGVWLVRH